MVKEFPDATPQVCHNVVSYFLEVMMGYQQWVQQLQETVVSQDMDIKKMQKTIDLQTETIKKVFENNIVQ